MNQTQRMRDQMAQSRDISPEKKFFHQVSAWQELNREVLETFLDTPQAAAKLWFSARNVLNSNPALLRTSASSFVSCLVMCAQLKLYPGAANEVALVPLGGQTQFWPMFKGLIKNGRRSGACSNVQAQEVCEHDEFDYRLGLRPRLHHQIDWRKKREDRGKVVAVYAVYNLIGAPKAFEIMSWEDIQEIKRNSPSVKKGRPSPWTSSFLTEIEMAKKTVIKRGFKDIDITPDFSQLIAVDNSVERHGRARIKELNIEGTFDPESGYAVEPEPYDEQPESEPEITVSSPEPLAIKHEERIAVSIPKQEEPISAENVATEVRQEKPMSDLEREFERAMSGGKDEEVTLNNAEEKPTDRFARLSKTIEQKAKNEGRALKEKP